MSIDNLTPLPEAILDLRREVDRDIKSYARMMRDRAAERISELESTRLAAQLLDGLGLEVEGYGRLAWLRVELGHFPNSHRGNRRLALAWRKLRRALGCRLEQRGTDVADARKKTVAVQLRPVDFPAVRIRYTRPLKKGGKCRIVKHTYTSTSLVCES